MNETILTGHTSAATAYVVDDYPYGFRLRCKIRYWLEYKPSKGFRLVSQTSNPKVAGEVWNKPKASTYSPFGVMTRDESNGHIGWTALHYYKLANAVTWLETYGAALPTEARNHLVVLCARGAAYERAKIAGHISTTITTTHIFSGQSPTVEKQILNSDYTAEEVDRIVDRIRAVQERN